jgi:hypothetical protein
MSCERVCLWQDLWQQDLYVGVCRSCCGAHQELLHG